MGQILRRVSALWLFVGLLIFVAATTPAVAAVPTTNTFPIQGGNVADCSDDFGAPRPGGRTHQGNDCFAAEGTPLLAVESGVIFADNSNSHVCGSTTGDLGGITIWLIGDSGTAYYYAHNSRNEVTVDGTRVSQGQVIAYVGDTGNACRTRACPLRDPSRWSRNSRDRPSSPSRAVDERSGVAVAAVVSPGDW